MNSLIIYEFPLNERIRVFIRLEQLFEQFNYYLNSENIVGKRAAISVLLDIMAIFKRNDLKSETIKELERQVNVLNKIAKNKNDDVNTQKVEELLTQLRDMGKQLYAMPGKIGNHLVDNDLFQSVAQRSSIPGGTCSFDLPEFHFWLLQNNEICLQDLRNWSEPFVKIGVAIDLALDIIRSSSVINDEIAPAGFFQFGLDTNLSNQLLRVRLENSQPYFVEISGGKHRCTIRFMLPSQDNKRATQCSENISFTLAQCIF